ncbi:hypothetical protein [Flavobacterium sp.]|uniref:hypothetical protein n=2 Tax=Flavobacterium sp. TaxID=239 RepID=UPI0040478A5A
MQEKVNKMTKIKERIIYFVENQGIKKIDFFNKIQVSSANFRGNAINTPLNSSSIENIIANYPQINLHWLITGKGEMLITKNKSEALKVEEPAETYGKEQKTDYELILKNNLLLKEQNQLQEELITMLKDKLQYTEEKLQQCEQDKNISQVTG